VFLDKASHIRYGLCCRLIESVIIPNQPVNLHWHDDFAMMSAYHRASEVFSNKYDPQCLDFCSRVYLTIISIYSLSYEFKYLYQDI
jgi:hypothetical protein